MADFNVLIDKRMGIIKSINRVILNDDEQEIFYTYSAESNKIYNYLNWRPDYIGSGTSLNKNKAYNSAVGELIERYSGNFIPSNLISMTVDEIKNMDFLSPEIFVKFSEDQYKRKGFPFKKFNSLERIEWVLGNSLITKKNILIPAKFVYLNYWMYKNKIKKIYQSPILLSGIAAGPNLRFALNSAILEIIERDTTMLWWIGNRKQKEIVIDEKDSLYSEIIKKLPINVKMRFFLLPSDFNVYTVATSLIDSENKIFNIGFATRFSINDAIEKSASEAMQLRRVSIDMIDQDSAVWKNPENKIYLGVKEYCKNRNYRKKFKKDWTDMISLKHNVQYFLDESTWKHALDRLDNINNKIFLNEINDIEVSNHVKYLISEFKKNNMGLYMVDITTEDINYAGYKVVRVISPEACPNMPTALSMLDNERLKNITSKDKNGNYIYDLSPLPHS